MTETRQDFDIWQGDSLKIKDDVSGGDITGHDISFRLYPYKGGDEVLEKTDADSGTEIIDSDTLTVKLDGTDTDGLDVRGEEKYYYRVVLTDGQGDEYTVTTGTITLHE